MSDFYIRLNIFSTFIVELFYDEDQIRSTAKCNEEEEEFVLYSYFYTKIWKLA